MVKKKTIIKTILLGLLALAIVAGVIVLGWILAVKGFINIVKNKIDEKENTKRKIVELAKENAINYIEDKYNFTPEIVSAEAIIDVDYTMLSSSINGSADIVMKHNGKKFNVEISGEEKTKEGYDDYQYDLIYNDILDLLTKELGNAPIEFDLSCNAEIQEGCKLNELYTSTSDLAKLNMTIIYGYYNENKVDYSNLKNYFSNSELVVLNYKEEQKNFEAFNFEHIKNIKAENIMEWSDYIKEAYVLELDPRKEFYFDSKIHEKQIGNLQVMFLDENRNSVDIEKNIDTNSPQGLDFWQQTDANIKTISDEFTIKTNYKYSKIRFMINGNDTNIKLCRYETNNGYYCFSGTLKKNYIEFGPLSFDNINESKFAIAYY